MAEETIILDVDDGEARAAIERVNRSIDGFEKNTERVASGAQRVVDAQGRSAQSVAGRSKAALESITGSLRSSLDAQFGQVRSAGAQVSEVLGNIPGAASLISFATKPVVALASGLALAAKEALSLVAAQGALAERTANTSARLGISIGEVQKLQASARIAGVDIQVLESAIVRVADTLNSSGPAADEMRQALSELGVATFTAGGKQREYGQILLGTLGALSRVDDSSQRLLLSQRALTREAAREIQPWIQDYRTLRDTVAKLGVGLDENITKNLAAADDEIGKLGEAWGVFKQALAEKIAPIIIPVVRVISDVVSGNTSLQQSSGSSSGFTQVRSRLERQAATQLGQVEGLVKLSGEQKKLSDAIRVALGASSEALAEPSREQAAARFRAERGRSLDGLQERLAALKEDQRKVSVLLGSSDIGEGARNENNRKLKALERQRAEVESRIKAIQDAPALRERIRKLFEEQGRARVGSSPEGKILIEAELSVKDARQESGQQGAIIAAETATLQVRQKFQEVQRKNIQDVVDGVEREKQLRLKAEADVFAERQRFRSETDQLEIQNLERRLDFEQVIAERERDSALRRVEVQASQTVTTNPQAAAAQRVQIETAKEKIEVEFLRRSERLQLESIDRRLKAELSALELLASVAAPDQQADIARRRAALEEGIAQQRAQIEIQTQSRIDEIRDRSEIERSRVIGDSYRRTYELIRSSFEQTLDSLWASSRSWGDRLRSIIDSVLLTPLKRAASQVFADAVTGGRGGVGSSGGGLFGSLGRALGGGASIATPTFSGAPLPIGWQGGGSRAASGALGLGGFGNPLDFLRRLGSLGTRGGQFGSGFGGVTGGLALLGGGILGFDGLRRGGLTGTLETAAGGALIGAKLGGPLGALIGFGVGLGAGLLRGLFKTATEKAITRVKNVYGITINNDLARQIVDIAKSSGGLDVAVQLPQVRDLVLYYGMATGQNTNGLTSSNGQPLSLVQRGGAIFQQPSFVNNQAFGYGAGSIPGLTGFTPFQQQPTIQVSVPAEEVGNFMQGHAVDAVLRSPGAVAQSVSRASSASSFRRRNAVNLMEPATVI